MTDEIINKTESLQNANNTSHYILITISVIVGLVGIFLRFVSDSYIIELISNIIFIVGIVIAFLAVFKILK